LTKNIVEIVDNVSAGNCEQRTDNFRTIHCQHRQRCHLSMEVANEMPSSGRRAVRRSAHLTVPPVDPAHPHSRRRKTRTLLAAEFRSGDEPAGGRHRTHAATTTSSPAAVSICTASRGAGGGAAGAGRWVTDLCFAPKLTAAGRSQQRVRISFTPPTICAQASSRNVLVAPRSPTTTAEVSVNPAFPLLFPYPLVPAMGFLVPLGPESRIEVSGE